MKNIIIAFIGMLCFQLNAQISQLGQTITQGQSTKVPLNNDFNNGGQEDGPTGFVPDRNVFWVHGLNGDIGSWADAATASEYNVAPGFPARKLKSITDIDYSQSNGLEEAGAQLGRIIEPYKQIQLLFGEDPERNFIIAHSQGGMVTRALTNLDYCVDFDPLKTLGYGGVVTYGTPHGGAQILNNKDMFADFAHDLCTNLTAGPAFDYAHKKLKFKVFGLSFKIEAGKVLPIEEIAEKVCDFVGDVLIPGITFSETPRITQDYEVGSSYLNELNSPCENIDYRDLPKVALYGVENEDGLMLRTLKYFNLSVNDYDYFAANEDNDAIDQMNQNVAKYLSHRVLHEQHLAIHKATYSSLKCDLAIGRILNFAMCSFLDNAIAKSKAGIEAWQKGLDWMMGSDDQYKIIIGALVYQTRTETWCRCTNRSTGEVTVQKLNPGDLCLGDPGIPLVCNTYKKTFIDEIRKDSDGVVLAESASNYPDAQVQVKMLNSSHMQMRNDDNTRFTLRTLYDGGYGKFFQTDEK